MTRSPERAQVPAEQHLPGFAPLRHRRPETSSSAVQAEALALAAQLNQPVYDCVDLVRACREVCSRLSADRRLLAMGRNVLP